MGFRNDRERIVKSGTLKAVIKAIIFDCFGVLTEDGWLAFQNKYATDETIEELRYLNHQADMGAISYEELLSGVTRLAVASRAEAHSVISTTHHPNEQLFEYIKLLKSSGYMLGVISNAGSELTNYLPAEYVNLFDCITLSYKIHFVKPDPEIYRAHLKALGVAPVESVFIDDRDYNVAGAKNAGMQAFVYSGVDQLKADLRSVQVAAESV